MAHSTRKREIRTAVLCIFLISLLFTGVAYVNYQPITEPTGALFIGQLTEVREIPGLPGYLKLSGFDDDGSLRLDLTGETRTLLDNPDVLGKEYTIRAEKHIRAKSNHEVYYIVTSMEASDGSFVFSWEDRAAVQAAALWWELPLAFGGVWIFGGVYLFYRYSDLPKLRYTNSNVHKRKYKRRK